MIILIDAYNLLKHMIKSDHASQNQINKFIKLIQNYSQAKKRNILLVFDGDVEDLLVCEQQDRVKIIFTGPYKSADDHIKRLVSEHRKNYILVSSDRELCSFVASYNVPTVDVDAFVVLLSKSNKYGISVKKSSENVYKMPTSKSNPQLDALMIEGSRNIMKKNEQEVYAKREKSKSKTLSREEKKILRLVKKL